MPKVRIDKTLEMHYEDDNFTDPWKKAETAVFQHCNGGSAAMYYRWAPLIARHYRFIRMDRRGHGQSTVPAPGYPWSLQTWAKEMRIFLDRLGLEKVHVIGEATGAWVCAQFAYEYPERLKSLCLVNYYPRLLDLPNASQFFSVLPKEGVEGWVRKTMYSRFDPNLADPEYVEWHLQEKLRQPAHVVQEVINYMATANSHDIMPKIQVPTLLIAAERNPIHPPEMSQRLAKVLPNAKVKVIPGVFGYVAHVAPEKCAEAWLDFAQNLR